MFRGLEKTAQAIVDLVGHAGGELAQHRVFFLVGETRGKF
jgi:hypothetical protein